MERSVQEAIVTWACCGWPVVIIVALFRNWNKTNATYKGPRWRDSLSLKSEMQTEQQQWTELHQVVQGWCDTARLKCLQLLSHQHGPQNTFSAAVLKIYFEKVSCLMSVGHEMYHDTNLPVVTGHLWCLKSRLMPLCLRLSCTEGKALLLPLEEENSHWKHGKHLDFCFVKLFPMYSCFYLHLFSSFLFRLSTLLSVLWLFLKHLLLVRYSSFLIPANPLSSVNLKNSIVRVSLVGYSNEKMKQM